MSTGTTLEERAATVYAGSNAELTRTSRFLLGAISLNSAAGALSGIFINVYLFKSSGDLLQVLAFHLASFLTWMPAFAFAGRIGKRAGHAKSMMLGNLGYLLLYLTVLLVGEHAGAYTVPLGILNGAACGFYWMSVNMLVVGNTTEANRDWFNGVNGMISSVNQLAGPLLAAGLIMALPHGFGYHLIFALSAALYGLSIAFGFTLPIRREHSPINWRKVVSVHKRPEWRRMSYSFTALHFRDDVLAFVLWLWMYTVLRDEGALGRFAFLLTLCSVIAYYVMGKRAARTGRFRMMALGSVGFSIGLLLLLFGISPYTLVAYTLLTGICSPLFQVPFTTALMNSITACDDGGRYRVELMIARELAISLGRIASVAGMVVLLWTGFQPESVFRLYIPLLIAAGLLPLVWMRRVSD